MFSQMLHVTSRLSMLCHFVHTAPTNGDFYRLILWKILLLMVPNLLLYKFCPGMLLLLVGYIYYTDNHKQTVSATELWKYLLFTLCLFIATSYHHNRFTALFPGPPGWAGARREPLVFMVQGNINRGRHTDHPAGRKVSIRTKQCPPPPSPLFFTGRMPFLPPNQQCQSTEGNSYGAEYI